MEGLGHFCPNDVNVVVLCIDWQGRELCRAC